MLQREDQQAPSVSTEPQRQALDEMSRQLVERLNDMVRKQNERARQFAATQHSLSPLPELPAAELPPAPTAVPEVAPRKQPILPPPPLPRQQESLPPTATPPAREEGLADWLKPAAESKPQRQAEEGGCGSISTILLLVLLFIIIRSCT